MTTTVFVVLSVLFTVAVVWTAISGAALRWHERNITLSDRDPRLYLIRWEAPPWYVRFTARVLQHPLDPPTLVGRREMK